jgi:hypothetical protein
MSLRKPLTAETTVAGLVPLLFETPVEAEAAARAIAELMAAVPVEELAWFDENWRQHHYSWRLAYGGWHELEPESLEWLAGFGAASFWLFGLATFHHNGYVRRAVVAALGRLGIKDSPIHLHALCDPSPGVSREACRVIAASRIAIGHEMLWTVLRDSESRHVRMNAFHLLARLPRWESLPYLMQALAVADDRVVVTARMWLGRWVQRFNKSFAQPSAAQRERIRGLLASYRIALGNELYRELEFRTRA